MRDSRCEPGTFPAAGSRAEDSDEPEGCERRGDEQAHSFGGRSGAADPSVRRNLILRPDHGSALYLEQAEQVPAEHLGVIARMLPDELADPAAKLGIDLCLVEAGSDEEVLVLRNDLRDPPGAVGACGAVSLTCGRASTGNGRNIAPGG